MSQQRRRASTGFRVQDRDVEIVRWLARVRLASVGEVQTRFGLARSKAYGRLKGLVDLGLVRHERAVPGHGVFLATRQGLALAGSSLAPAMMSLGALRHDLAVSRVVAEIERSSKLPLWTERELRARHHQTGEKWFRPRINRHGMRQSRHWPDLIVPWGDGPQAWIALEVELSMKSAERTQAILDGYEGSRFEHPQPQLIGVMYFVPADAGRRRVERLAAREQLTATSYPVTFAAAVLGGRESPVQAIRRLLEGHQAGADRQRGVRR